ncbi:unnamed protein product [Rotaria sordida]|uniref:Uncharacterized protein n=1 Tax=Rotaria sordida TaxID=392033 RepID=A0A813TGG6_9BILA|nr:unnamed protein product [Rotaria sordida]CAF3700256.1 unnamed protein product [Rotaria sordida]
MLPKSPRVYGTSPDARARARFIPRAPPSGGVGIRLGSDASAGGLGGLIGGIGAPLLCLGCLSTLALLGLFGTMIGAAAYMNGIQTQIRKTAQSAGTTIELNIVVLLCALLCSIYVLTKYRRGGALNY